MITTEIQLLRIERKKAKKTGQKLYATLAGKRAEVIALTECAPRYGCAAFRCVNGDGWYPLTGAEFTFAVQ